MIVTHTAPDWDAIGSAWLLKRFGGLSSHDVVFVNTGNPDQELLKQAKAVVDTGKVFDPASLRFDHHQLPGSASNETSATEMVYADLIRRGYGVTYQAEDWEHGYEYLEPLINLITAGDTGDSAANESREIGIHSLLSGFKAITRQTDQKILEFGFMLLDTIELNLRRKDEARKELKEKVVYKSEDRLVWGIKHGSSRSSFAAYDEGARIVVFEGAPIETESGISYPVGISRSSEWIEPHVGKLAEAVTAAFPEVESWFKHNGGFFAGAGTDKAPRFTPPNFKLEELARAIDKAWKR